VAEWLTHVVVYLFKVLQHDHCSPIVSIIYNRLIANITLLKPLSFTSLILSTMQLIMGSPLFLSLSASVLHSTQLTSPFSSIVSLPVSASWVPLTTGLSLIARIQQLFFRYFRLLFLSHLTGLSPISPTGLFQSRPAPLPVSSCLHLVEFPEALS